MLMMNQEKIIFLGDSYTIGEGVDFNENFPNKLIKKLSRLTNATFTAKIIAKTGWTTGELLAALQNTATADDFKIATLLIGVNNQYRGLDIEIYKKEFEVLLKRAISFVTNPNSVIVISIPDWGQTPFAKDRDKSKISWEIDQYNSINRSIAAKYQSHYLDITSGYRLRSNAAEFIAGDGLHPSSAEYEFWTNQLLELIRDKKLNQ
jgi:lysophospholipase L1-like esterase